MSVGKRDYFFKVADFIGLCNFECMAKTNLAILPFLSCGEVVKNSIFEYYTNVESLNCVVVCCCSSYNYLTKGY